MIAAVMGVSIGHELVRLRTRVDRTLGGLRVNGTARHTANRNRVERK